MRLLRTRRCAIYARSNRRKWRLGRQVVCSTPIQLPSPNPLGGMPPDLVQQLGVAADTNVRESRWIHTSWYFGPFEVRILNR